MATIAELRYWCFGGDAPAEGGESLPDSPIFRAMAYRFAPEKYSCFRDDYRRAAMNELPLSVEYRRIANAFREKKIRFAPIKGADLAESCYPDPALRVRCDIDLLIHADDIGRAVETAGNEGWRAAHEYRNLNHVPSMYKKNAMLELHFNLPDFPRDRSAEVWQTLVAQNDSSEYRLPRELALVVAFRHARIHRWMNSAPLIADCAFLLKAGVDWELVRNFAAKFDSADPALLCFALPELFPAETMPPGPPPPEELRLALREALLHPVNFDRRRDADVMNRGDRFGAAWWKERMRGFSPASVRMNYNLPDSAGFWRMTAAYFRMCGDKAKLAWRGMRGKDPELTAALRRVERIEKELESLKK